MFTGLTALVGCAPHPAELAAAPPPNPFGYLRPAQSCVAPPISAPASGPVSDKITVSNDGGYCALRVSKAGGGQFASFIVVKAPLHGQPLDYNYNDASVITYTPKTGYTGSDTMTVELVPGASMPRTTLTLTIDVVPAGHPAA